MVHRLSCSMAHGIFPDHRLNTCLLALAGGFFTTEPPGKRFERFMITDSISFLVIYSDFILVMIQSLQVVHF